MAWRVNKGEPASLQKEFSQVSLIRPKLENCCLEESHVDDEGCGASLLSLQAHGC